MLRQKALITFWRVVTKQVIPVKWFWGYILSFHPKKEKREQFGFVELSGEMSSPSKKCMALEDTKLCMSNRRANVPCGVACVSLTWWLEWPRSAWFQKDFLQFPLLLQTFVTLFKLWFRWYKKKIVIWLFYS